MKRSEMLKKLEYWIWFNINHLSGTRREDAINLAEIVLNLVEEEGMLPPINEKSRGQDAEYHRYEWGPEDEKK